MSPQVKNQGITANNIANAGTTALTRADDNTAPIAPQ